MTSNILENRLNIHLPATFEERGAAVPFTTAAIAFARIRETKEEELEALVPGLSGARGTYVLPWPGMRDIVSMSVYDRQLHKVIEAEKALTPAKIREHALELSKSGVSGTDAARKAQKALEREIKIRVKIRQVLLQELVDRFGDQPEKLDIAAMSEQEAMLAAGRALGGFAKNQSLSGDHLIDMLIEWCRLIQPVGFPEQDCAGYMRQRVHDMRDFQHELDDWSESEPPSSQRAAQGLARAARAFITQAENCLSSIDECRKELQRTVLEWQGAGKSIAQEIERMDWFLDGWDVVMESWCETKDLDRHDQRDRVDLLHHFMPILPEVEIEAGDHEFWEAIMAQQDGEEEEEEESDAGNA